MVRSSRIPVPKTVIGALACRELKDLDRVVAVASPKVPGPGVSAAGRQITKRGCSGDKSLVCKSRWPATDQQKFPVHFSASSRSMAHHDAISESRVLQSDSVGHRFSQPLPVRKPRSSRWAPTRSFDLELRLVRRESELFESLQRVSPSPIRGESYARGQLISMPSQLRYRLAQASMLHSRGRCVTLALLAMLNDGVVG